MPLARLTDPIGQVRLGRYSSPGEVSVAELRAHGSRHLFVDLASGQAVAQALVRTERLGYCRTLAWVLLPDRLIWLSQLLPDGGTQARVIGSLKGRSTWLIGQHHPKLGGRIWAAGYNDCLITTRKELLSVTRMIIRRPVSEGLVSRSMDYPFWDAIGLARPGPDRTESDGGVSPEENSELPLRAVREPHRGWSPPPMRGGPRCMY